MNCKKNHTKEYWQKKYKKIMQTTLSFCQKCGKKQHKKDMFLVCSECFDKIRGK